jgi:pyruvate,water dikinase
MLADARARAGRELDEHRRETERLRAVDIAPLEDAALIRHAELVMSKPALSSRSLFFMISALPAMGLLDRLFQGATGEEGASRRLMSGVGGMESAEAGVALWRLGERARDPEVSAALAGATGQDAARAVLSGSENGRAFLAAFDEFLDRHGHHARIETDVAAPRWREQPEHLLSLVRAAAGSGAAPLAAEQERREAARRLRVEEALARLGPLRRALARRLLARAEAGLRTRENMRSDSARRLEIVRRVALEAGRRLVSRDVLAAADDVFFLTLEELPAALARDPALDVRATVGARRAEHARNVEARPPPIVVGRFDPRRHLPPAPPAGMASVLRGLGVSAGLAEGRARVLLRADVGAHLEPGEVLVAPFTDPGWTPYFIPAAAIVMDFGGMLSHGSVVAREYGIPAVVNVGAATARIRDGQRIRVDGDRGEVWILDEP